MPVLQLDVGNSSTKWRLMEGERRVDGGRCSLREESLDALCALGASAVWVASVASDEEEQRIEGEFRCRGVVPKFARTQSQCGSVRNSYTDPGRMGVDRWLAMLAGDSWAAGGVVVVDAGTAATIDLVDDRGAHIGGYILPGFKLMCASLTGNTGRVRYAGAADVSVRPGRQTGDCVEAAAWLALLSSVRGAVGQYMALEGAPPKVVLTGGDAKSIVALAGADAAEWLFVDERVLDGLQIAVRAEAPGAG